MMKTLTGAWKMMNMAKLGIVSTAGNYFHSLWNPCKQRAVGMTCYTLCVFGKMQFTDFKGIEVKSWA